MRGETVIVRLHEGKAKVLQIWSATSEIAEVTTSEMLASAASEGYQPITIGVSIEDVFEHSTKYSTNLDSVDWAQLKKWKFRRNSNTHARNRD